MGVPYCLVRYDGKWNGVRRSGGVANMGVAIVILFDPAEKGSWLIGSA